MNNVLDLPARRDLPQAPADLLAVTRERWETYWSSDVAKVASAVDLGAVERYFRYADDWERCYRAYRKTPLVKGSTGQPVENPLGKRLLAVEGHMARLEDQLGLTPLARMRLGVAFGEAARTIEDLNRSLDADDGEDEDDPRLAAMEQPAQDG